MKQKSHGEYVRPDPSTAAANLMRTRGWKPVCADLPKRSSPRVGRVTTSSKSLFMHNRPTGFKDRITLPSIWEKKE